jgi:hypothetical protein
VTACEPLANPAAPLIQNIRSGAHNSRYISAVQGEHYTVRPKFDRFYGVSGGQNTAWDGNRPQRNCRRLPPLGTVATDSVAQNYSTHEDRCIDATSRLFGLCKRRGLITIWFEPPPMKNPPLERKLFGP